MFNWQIIPKKTHPKEMTFSAIAREQGMLSNHAAQINATHTWPRKCSRRDVVNIVTCMVDSLLAVYSVYGWIKMNGAVQNQLPGERIEGRGRCE